ncbi:hypothetical protein BCR33DRAFT_713817 [Rhizoclosmatium globosum]|uniref:Uncharacterized protein n=1 Tax=Rhizoclosmatium globosum TaxID=329046 RepID=A0A1Y2CT21_9FUNG|nr:hypothetical protein BCR33DRAFT_713817 [Rhizoclosmatium globosum]|eukprot:ORY49515.1 hypothetical protein BCR33DRAFT_713817 [Rhizoclosmatium globosum]
MAAEVTTSRTGSRASSELEWCDSSSESHRESGNPGSLSEKESSTNDFSLSLSSASSSCTSCSDARGSSVTAATDVLQPCHLQTESEYYAGGGSRHLRYRPYSPHYGIENHVPRRLEPSLHQHQHYHQPLFDDRGQTTPFALFITPRTVSTHLRNQFDLYQPSPPPLLGPPDPSTDLSNTHVLLGSRPDVLTSEGHINPSLLEMIENAKRFLVERRNEQEARRESQQLQAVTEIVQ